MTEGCTLVKILSLIALFAGHLVWAQNAVLSSAPRAVAGEYIVKMKVRPGFNKLQSQESGERIIQKLGAGIYVKKAFANSSMLHIKAQSQSKVDFLRSHPDVEFIEPNYILSVDPSSVQAAGVAPSSTDQYTQSHAPVQTKEAWGIAKPYDQGEKVIVAVVDTGLDLTHPVFTGSDAIWNNDAEINGVGGVDDDGNGYIDDYHGWNFAYGTNTPQDDTNHGTHVSGIILGATQDIFANPVREARIRIMPLKFLNSSGSGTTADAVNAIYYAIANGARVINDSWGGSAYSRSLHEAYTYANSRNVVITSAAGNANSNNDSTPTYPAVLDSPNNIAVAASTDDDRRASFSNYGSSVLVASPGNYIVSTVIGSSCGATGCFSTMSGTSMATPFVAGIAALVFREAPQLSAYQVRSIIAGSVDTASTFLNVVSTSGRVNVYKAVQSAQGQVSTAYWSPSYSPVYKAASSRDVASGAAGAVGCGLVKNIDSGGPGDGEGGTTSVVNTIVVVLLSMIPIAIAFGLRNKEFQAAQQAAGYKRRQYARYNLAKDIVIKVGDQSIQAASDTLSIGGLSFHGNVDFDKGQKIKVSIGGVEQEIEGEVVWCSQKQSYGVRFLDITDQLRMAMKMWTVGLTPT